MRSALVVAEVALSTLLMIGAGLLVRSYAGLQRVNPGFAPHNVLTMALTLPEYKYTDDGRRLQFYEASLNRIRRLSGVRAAGFVNVLPFSTYNRSADLMVEGAPPPEIGREPSVAFRVASDGYLETMRIPVVAGRPFDAGDRADAPPVAVVNRAFVRRFLDSRSAIGRRIRLGRSEDLPWLTVVGVVGDVRHSQLTEIPDPEVYVPLTQSPPSMVMLAVRTDLRAADLTGAIRAEIHAIDAGQPVYHVKSLERLVGDAMLAQSFSASLMTLFGAVALVLAAVGIYGVVSYAVNQQTREFGVRIALGASPRHLLTHVLGYGILLVGTGIVLGASGSLALSQLIAGALYGVGPADPITYLAVIALLCAIGVVASGVPAWRASRIQPITALRAE